MLTRSPELVPPAAGVFALVNERRRYVYVSYTQNLQKRSHSMSHMLLQHDEWLEERRTRPKGTKRRLDPLHPYWPIRDLPKRPSDEFTFFAFRQSLKPADAIGAVHKLQKSYEKRGYKIVKGHRASSGFVRVGRHTLRLSEAVRRHSKSAYLTVYRRLQRGWTVRQALGLDPPAPRWHSELQRARRSRMRGDGTWRHEYATTGRSAGR